MQKPGSMKTFDLLYLGSIVVGLLGLAFGWDGLVEQMVAEFSAQGVEADAQTASFSLILGFAFASVINVALWFLVSVLRIEFVKWLLVIFLVYGIFSIVVGVSESGFDLTQITAIVSTAMSIGAIYFLFQPASKEWLAAKRGD